MAGNHRIVIVVVLIAPIAWGSVLAWFSFHPIRSQHFEQNTPVLLMLALAGVAPLYPLCRLAKRWPRLLGGIVVVAIVGVITSVYIVAHYLVGLNSVWLDRIPDLDEGLMILASVLLVWGGAKARG